MSVSNPEILDFAQLAFADSFMPSSRAEAAAGYNDGAVASQERVVSGSYRDTFTTDLKHGCGSYAREVMGLDTNHEAGHCLFLGCGDEAGVGCLADRDNGEIFDSANEYSIEGSRATLTLTNWGETAKISNESPRVGLTGLSGAFYYRCCYPPRQAIMEDA